MTDAGQNQRSPTFGQVLNRVREVTKRQIKVALPATVQDYDASTQTVDLQVMTDDQIQQEDGSYTALPYPILTHVPVGFLAAGGFRITFPIQQGDTGQVIICDHSLDAWKKAGGHLSPTEQRRHHIADAVFYPGLHPDSGSWTGASTTSITLGKDGGPQIVLRSGTVELGGSDSASPPDFALKGTSFVNSALSTLDTAWETFLTALGTFNTALTTYATGIQPNADSMNSFTPALLTAITTFTAAAVTMGAALTAFQTAAAADVSTIVKIG